MTITVETRGVIGSLHYVVLSNNGNRMILGSFATQEAASRYADELADVLKTKAKYDYAGR